MRKEALILLAALCTLLPIGAQTLADRHAGWMMVDFRAYYCAALVQREGKDPYYAQPLHACESTTPVPFYRAPAKVTVPAPYPPYALALLVPLTFVPFAAAAIVWWMLVAAAIALAAWAVSRITDQPLVVGWAAFGLSLGLTSFAEGNAMPLAVAAIAIAALCCQREKMTAAAIAAAAAMVEPNIGLPAAIGLFVGFSRARLPLGVAALAVAGLSLVGGGVAHNVEYLTAVLPAHALSEVSRDNQYSLSTIASAFGATDHAAVWLGTASYVVMLALGVVAGLQLRHRYDDRAFAILIPPAFALVGGSFVHTEAIAAAVPAALLLFTRAREYRAWSFAALVLLAVPWMFATSVSLFLAPLFPVAYLTYVLWNRERAVWAATAIAAFAVAFALFALAAAPSQAIPALHARAPIDPRLAESAWRDFVLGDSTNRLAMWLLRLPTWLGLLVAAGVALVLPRTVSKSTIISPIFVR